ncbi:helix-turn-helix domain-containing protein [Streptomyces sp. NPDC058122]|uniref:helix-turn-helix domain-containing protein n=1 Tax=Streptomyces sp. NPDC058122 TaxID=3346349 RepID=UPI0036E8A9A5
MCALWSARPVTVRLDDLDMICAALKCTVADLMEAEPLASRESGEQEGSERSARARVRAAAGGRCRSRAAARAPCGACRRTEQGGTGEQSRLVRPVRDLGHHHGIRPVLRVPQRPLPAG